MRKLLFLAALLLALPAHAITIVNLDEKTHILVVDNAGERREITLPPGRSYTTYGPMVDIGLKARTGTTLRRAEVFGDYAIWGDGKLFLQMVRQPHLR